MASGFSKGDLLDFLDFMADKGLGGPSMISGRKAAVNALLSILSDEDVRDVRELDLDEVAKRFINLKGNKFKPASVRVYRSRAQSAINDLVRYRQDPIAFKPTGNATKRSSSSRPEKPQAGEAGARNASPTTEVAPAMSEITFPIPLRPGVVVRLIGIPNDLSKREAAKISNIVTALVHVDDEADF